MDRPTGGGIGWLGRLFGRSSDEPGAQSGSEEWVQTEQALGALEVLTCEGFVHTPAIPPSAAAARRREPTDGPPLNAFGRPVHEEVGSGAGGSVALATGMALAGLRATAFLSGDELLAAHEDLCATAERRAPLVLHAVNVDDGHSGYHRVAGCGWFQVLASSGQEALDLSLLARWLAERALVPGLVATDGGALERLRVPDSELVRTFLGHPGEALVSPTEAQRLLFGDRRSRLLRWFDPDRPVATGGIRSRADQARVRVAGHTFFWNHLTELAEQGMQEFERLTGRRLCFVHRHRLRDADLVLVAQGSTVQSACDAADDLRRRRGWKIGVLGVTWLRPFPAQAVAEALSGRRAVAVIESLDDPLAAETPLRREIEAALPASFRCTAATCAAPGPDPGQLAELCRRMRAADPPRWLRLDRMTLAPSGDYPRREALVQSLGSAYPELRRTEPADADGAEAERGEIRSVGLVGLEAELAPNAAAQLAGILADAAGSNLRGKVTRPEPGVIAARLRAAASASGDPGPLAPVERLLVTTPRCGELGEALSAVAHAGVVLIADGAAPDRVWTSLPARWRAEIRGRDLRVFTVDEDPETGIETIRACLEEGEAALVADGRLREIAWREMADVESADPVLPKSVRRIGQIRPSHDSLPRFWGELLQHRLEGAPAGFADPLEASGAVPAGASALQPVPTGARLPILDANACTGCGSCWTHCPDSALGVTVLGTETLFTACSRVAGTEGQAADALRRAHKHLAAHLGSQLKKNGAGSVDAAACREAWDWLSARMGISEEELPAHQEAFEATAEVLSSLQPVVTPPFFHDPEGTKKGDGELLVLTVDPRACLGCNLCVKICPEEALELTEPTPECVARAEQGWQTWERLPDTAGSTLARAAEHTELGELAGTLLSRHCAQAQIGDATGEPGSGERLAARWIAALVEEHAQRQVAKRIQELEETRTKLETAVREQLAAGLSKTHMDTLAEALGEVSGGKADLSALAQRLDALGAPASFDRRGTLRATRLAAELEQARWRLAEGQEGLGRARFGVVVTQGSVAEWAGRYPRHPYWAPLTVAPTARAAEVARGLARGLVAEHVSLVRMLKRANLELEAPPDRKRQLEKIAQLSWADLTAEDRAGCPPLLLLGDEGALLDQGFEVLTQLLDSDLPVKVVLFDGRGRLAAPPEPALLAMAHRRAFVLAASLAHPDHLARGTRDALHWSGPALIHLHAPSPRRHGFAADATLVQARRALEGRAHPLFRYDPRAEGLFGLRSSLEGNPGLDQTWGGACFPEWAAGESRFEDCFVPSDTDDATPLETWLALPELERQRQHAFVEVEGERLVMTDRMARAAADRIEVWNTLREISGTTSPFTDGIRAALAQELEAEQAKTLQGLKTEYTAALAAAGEGDDPATLQRLTDRLMALAGYSSGPPHKPSNGDGG